MPRPASSPALWEARIRRAEHLAGQAPAAAALLAFYAETARFQAALASPLEPAPPGPPAAEQGSPFQQRLDLERCLAALPDLLALIERVGTPVLAESAKALADAGADHWRRLLRTYWETGGAAVDTAQETSPFFARAVLQPLAVNAADHVHPPSVSGERRVCPICGGKPVVGVLRREGLGAKRSLICNLCLTEWEFPRVLCPNCGEEEFEALPVFTAEGFEHIRINACDRCHTYLKTVDLTKNGHAVPEVDEIAAVSLGLWAAERGYTKVEVNLLGM